MQPCLGWGLRVCIPDMLPLAAIRSTFARKVLCILISARPGIQSQGKGGRERTLSGERPIYISAVEQYSQRLKWRGAAAMSPWLYVLSFTAVVRGLHGRQDLW